MARVSVRPSGYTILVVDDQEEIVRSTRRLLEREGHRVLAAAGGIEALDIFRRERPHLLVVDYFMPGMTGEELIRQIRREDETVQILLQTGYSGEKPAHEMLDLLDIQGYHDKADGADKLRVWVRVCLKAHRQLQRAREAERLKGELLANMSHEIRTPLTISLGSLELVLDGACGTLTSRAREMLGHVQSNTTALLSLVTDLLDLAKLETRTADARLESIALASLHGETKDAIERHAGGKTIDLDWQVDDDAPAVRADRAKLALVFSQVLASAVGGMSSGSIVVRAVEVEPGRVGCIVRYPGARGTPIPRSAVAGGQGGDSAPARDVGAELASVGLGVARRVARGMGGDLLMSAGADVGATFTIVLPLAGPAAGTVDVDAVTGRDDAPAPAG